MELNSSAALELVDTVTKRALAGVGPLCSASVLAEQYLNDNSLKSLDEKIDALIKWEMTKNFSTGFVTGLGGIITLPVTIPAALGATWVIQARMVAAIAAIYGYDIANDRVRTLVILTMAGDHVKDILKEAGVQITTRLTYAAIQQIPGRVLIEINRLVGFRLITKAGEKGVINLGKAIPFAGGILGGSIDAAFCKKVGEFAKNTFSPKAKDEG